MNKGGFLKHNKIRQSESDWVGYKFVGGPTARYTQRPIDHSQPLLHFVDIKAEAKGLSEFLLKILIRSELTPNEDFEKIEEGSLADYLDGFGLEEDEFGYKANQAPEIYPSVRESMLNHEKGEHLNSGEQLEIFNMYMRKEYPVDKI